MLGRSKRARDDHVGGEASTTQPLLSSSQDDLHDGSEVLFKLDDEDDADYVEASALGDTDSLTPKSKHRVHFREEVQVFAPALRSTGDSREAGE